MLVTISCAYWCGLVFHVWLFVGLLLFVFDFGLLVWGGCLLFYVFVSIVALRATFVACGGWCVGVLVYCFVRVIVVCLGVFL